MNQYHNDKVLWGKAIDVEHRNHYLPANKNRKIKLNTNYQGNNQKSDPNTIFRDQGENLLDSLTNSQDKQCSNHSKYLSSKWFTPQVLTKSNNALNKNRYQKAIKQQEGTYSPSSKSSRHQKMNASPSNSQYLWENNSLRRKSQKNIKLRNNNEHYNSSSNNSSKKRYNNQYDERNSSGATNNSISISKLGDEQLISDLKQKYGKQIQNKINSNTKISPIRSSKLYQSMQRSKLAKDNEINVLSVFKDQLKLIQFFIKDTGEIYKKQGKNNLNNYNNMKKHRIQVSTLQAKSQCIQQLLRQQYALSAYTRQFEQQSRILSQYMVYIIQKLQQNNPTTLTLNNQQQLVSNNLNYQLQYLTKQLKLLKNNNMKQNMRISREILQLRISIKKKEDKLKILNSSIFQNHIRNNKRARQHKNTMREIKQQQQNAQNQLGRVIISGMQVLEEEKVYQQIDNNINSNGQLPSNLQNKLKSITFSYRQNNQISPNFQCNYQNQQSLYNTSAITIPLSQKLKSLTFYFDINKIFVGLQAKYANVTHSYDIGRQNQIMTVGQCDQNLQKFQFTCKNKHIIAIGSLRLKTEDKSLVGFVLYFHKKNPSNPIYLPRMQAIKNSRNSSRKASRNSSCDRISVNSKQGEQDNPYEVGNKQYPVQVSKRQKVMMQKFKGINNHSNNCNPEIPRTNIGNMKNKGKGGQATTQYCLINS